MSAPQQLPAIPFLHNLFHIINNNLVSENIITNINQYMKVWKIDIEIN